MMSPKSDSNTRDRANRLVELRKEAAVAFNCSDPMTTAERHLVECWSALKLGFEVLSARLVGGANVDVVELIKLNEALSAYMPQRKAHQVDKLIIEFVDGGPSAEQQLHAQVAKLQRKIDELEDQLAGRSPRPAGDSVRIIPDQHITPPTKQLPSPAKADEAAAMGWTSVLGGGACHWTAAGGYSRPVGE
jgi:hypothetical protein